MAIKCLIQQMYVFCGVLLATNTTKLLLWQLGCLPLVLASAGKWLRGSLLGEWAMNRIFSYIQCLVLAFVIGVAIVLNKVHFGAVYKSEFILRFRFLREGDSSRYLGAIDASCRRSDLLHMEPSGDNLSLSLTYDVALKDDVTAEYLTGQIGALDEVSEVVLIASKNDVDY